ncbi:MAG: hypothetical protein PHS49_07730 [Candidatus Gracilibacteria bacterium]|nr:hypothetical protein [Candidatus Gracilibacteria bacterium]
MAEFEGGYKLPDIGEKSGIENIPLTNESQDTTKNELDGLKKQIDNQNNQLNVKIEETIDTFEDLSGKKLDEKQKEELMKLLQDGASKSGKPNQYIGEILGFVKEFDNTGTFDDLKNLVVENNNNYSKITAVEKTETAVEKTETAVEKTETAVEKTETAVEKTETAVEQKKEEKEKVKNIYENKSRLNNDLGNLSNSLNGLNENSPNFDKYSGVISKLNHLDLTKSLNEGYDAETQKQINEIITELKNPAKLKFIADDLKAQDEREGTHKFTDFQNSLNSIDGEFREIFDNLGDTEAKAKVYLGTDSLSGVDIGNNTLKKKTDDGYDIEFGKDGRKLSLSDSEYKLDSKLDNSEEITQINEVENKFKKELKALNEDLNTISGIIDFIDQSIANKENLENVKQEIKSQNNVLFDELNIDNMGSLEEIKDSIVGLYKQKEEEKEAKIKEKKKLLDEIVQKNAQKAKEADEKKKDTLAFLKSIGFDKIDQSITDNIINQLNSNTGLRNMLGFNGVIDLENGSLGTNADANNQNVANQEKVNFAKMFNIMLSGKPDGILNIDNLQNDRGNPISDMTKLNIIKLIQNINVGTKLCSIFFAHFLTKPLQLC